MPSARDEVQTQRPATRKQPATLKTIGKSELAAWASMASPHAMRRVISPKWMAGVLTALASQESATRGRMAMSSATKNSQPAARRLIQEGGPVGVMGLPGPR